MELTAEDRAKIEELLSLPADGLFSILPAYSPEYEHTSFAPEGQLKAGRQIFERLRARLHQLVCIEWDYCEKRRSDKYQDPVVLVASVADVISASLTGVPPFVVSTLLVKIGLSRFCECD
jgi:hypothetical protein